MGHSVCFNSIILTTCHGTQVWRLVFTLPSVAQNRGMLRSLERRRGIKKILSTNLSWTNHHGTWLPSPLKHYSRTTWSLAWQPLGTAQETFHGTNKGTTGRQPRLQACESRVDLSCIAIYFFIFWHKWGKNLLFSLFHVELAMRRWLNGGPFYDYLLMYPAFIGIWKPAAIGF
ncbi:hypothetical protein CH063_07985 [Colletotrichum higginsianum]|uniref:Uncharacterized protein n=1 Tax=Colletotrichum higginsianum (strain IMI 349063) TaxID=759273 RepID=H1V851_COLHI|nr:hypothetical protein CH063_07985 [Colletotrichum higginsianum]